MTSSTALPRDTRARLQSRIAWFAWIGFIVILTAVAGGKALEGKNTVVPAYRQASLAWTSSQPIYELQSIHGFLYLPASAVLTVPLALLPPPAHEFAFRWISILLLAWSLHRLSKVLEPTFGRDTFLVLSLCAIATSVGPARAGQMNLLLAATMAMATADAIAQRWWPAALWLGLGFALKPQGIVLAALLIVLCPPLRVKAGIMIIAALALPFLFQAPAYVVDQYQLCLQKLAASGRPGEAGVNYNDISGLTGALGITFSENLRWLLRAFAALFTLLACAFALRRKPTPHGLIFTLALAATYLVLFNPRTEGGSYVIVAVPVAVFLAREILERRRGGAALLVALVAGWTLSYEISQRLWSLGHGIGLPVAPTFRGGFGPYWLSPTLGVIFLCFLLLTLFAKAKASTPSRMNPAEIAP